MNLNTDHYARYIRTLETSLLQLAQAEEKALSTRFFVTLWSKDMNLLLRQQASCCVKRLRHIPEAPGR